MWTSCVPPPTDSFFSSISCGFLEIFAKLYVGVVHSQLCDRVPLYVEALIRHWLFNVLTICKNYVRCNLIGSAHPVFEPIVFPYGWLTFEEINKHLFNAKHTCMLLIRSDQRMVNNLRTISQKKLLNTRSVQCQCSLFETFLLRLIHTKRLRYGESAYAFYDKCSCVSDAAA